MSAKVHQPFTSELAPETHTAQALFRRFGGRSTPVLVAVGGPGGVGKSGFAHKLAAQLGQASVLELDHYKTARSERSQNGYYGAHPKANQIMLIRKHLEALRSGDPIERPLYCRERGGCYETETFSPRRYVIVEGEVSTYKEFADCIDFSIFIDSHWKTQLNTRLQRDIEQRGYSPEKAIDTFLNSNLREFARFGANSRSWADLHIHCAADYSLSIDAICVQNLPFFTGISTFTTA